MQGEGKKHYEMLLHKYLLNQEEFTLYEAEKLSKKMIDQGISPDTIISFHKEAMTHIFPDLSEENIRSFQFLLEMMVGYGLQYREHQNLIKQQVQMQSELDIAAGMQQTLLPEVPSHVPEIDLGIISVAANKVSGDYYHFHYHPKRSKIGIAIADIIGKGIPAALCMSMIKYAIESLPEPHMEANTLLENINRVVEKNIDPSMFITMLYGSYDLKKHKLDYATAGHEPAIYFSHKDDSYDELLTKGVVLGLANDSTYINFSVEVDPGDMVILYTDGVTESRRNGQFIEREQFIEMIQRNKHLEAQQMADAIQQEIFAWSDYTLRDDQTIIILKRPLIDKIDV